MLCRGMSGWRSVGVGGSRVVEGGVVGGGALDTLQ